MRIEIKSYDGFDVREFEVTKAEAREIEYAELTYELHEVEKWLDKEDEIYSGASDQESFYISLDGGDEVEYTDYEPVYDSDWDDTFDIRSKPSVDAVGYCKGEFSYCFEIDEEFDPARVNIHFHHFYDQDYGVATGVTYTKKNGEEIEADYDEDYRIKYHEEPMIYM